jgi:hypothetical protein
MLLHTRFEFITKGIGGILRKKAEPKTEVFVESTSGSQVTIEGASRVTLTSQGSKVVFVLQDGKWALVSQ